MAPSPPSLAAEHASPASRPSATPGAIARLPTGVTAFVGRTLRGPLNQPVAVTGFAEFQRQFGGLWQPAPLGYAVEQFFDNGGQRAIIVRVANGARAPTLRIPAGPERLLLRGVAPGSREFLRASVDYDGIAADAGDQFNLVLQRLRSPETELVEDQEILRRVSIRADSPACIERALAASRLARVAAPLPLARPDRTPGDRPGAPAGYVHAEADGTDGAEPTDYDLIGDADAGTGMFALRGAERFDLMCVPPPARDLDVGLAAWLVASRLCRSRQALLLVDPPSGWQDASRAVAAAARWPLHSEDAALFYPRLMAADRLRGRPAPFVASGAVAGALARAGSSPGWWRSAGLAPLRPACRLVEAIAPVDRVRLAQHGVNVLDAARPLPDAAGTRTLLRERAAAGVLCDLHARRFTLWLKACVLEGTRWLLSAPHEARSWKVAQRQVTEFLAGLAGEQAFAGELPVDRYYVVCDARLNRARGSGPPRQELLFGVALVRPGDFQSFLVTHEAAGSSVRPVSVNYLAMQPGNQGA